MKTHLSAMVLVTAAIVMSSSMAAYGVITHNEDVEVQDTIDAGTRLALRATSGEATFIFANLNSTANAPEEIWRFRVQPSTDGLSFVNVRPNSQEMFRITTGGDLFLVGNIVPHPGSANQDICIGKC